MYCKIKFWINKCTVKLNSGSTNVLQNLILDQQMYCKIKSWINKCTVKLNSGSTNVL